jgi:DNA-binding MarR family transcriptional regulator
LIWLELTAAGIGGAVVGWFAHALFRARSGRSVSPPSSTGVAPNGIPQSSAVVPSPAPFPSIMAAIAPGVSEGANLAGKVIVHLSLLGRLGNDEVGRLGFTQAGMSETLGIRQGTLTKVLSRLEAARVVEVDRRHVQGQSRRLNVYRLTALGESVARDIRHRGPALSEAAVKSSTGRD